MAINSWRPGMDNDLVSVVIPTFNYGHFITEALESVFSQTYPHFEVIVVDDGSTDDTREKLEPFRKRIQYIYKKNGGLSAARNTGIEASRPNLVALLDSDDLWHPKKLEIQVGFLKKHPEIALLGSGAIRDMLSGWPSIEDVNSQLGKAVTLPELVIRSHFAPSSVIIRRECLNKVGLFDTDLRAVEDRDMWIRIASCYEVSKLQVPLVYYRVHNGNMSLAAGRMEENELKVLRKAFANIQTLRGRFLLRQKAFSYAAFSAAYMYGAGGNRLRSLTKMLRSFMLWPLPYHRADARKSFIRPKMLIVNILRMLGLKQNEMNNSHANLQTVSKK
jgi:glycosyltransferase involved in cell wall biosynthesis